MYICIYVYIYIYIYTCDQTGSRAVLEVLVDVLRGLGDLHHPHADALLPNMI